MANRYTQVTPSAYTPLTLEEIAMVPAMKRKQHDEILAKQELIRAGLAKTDPYSKHFDEAVGLKRGIEGDMDTMATQLSEQGINQDMIGKTIALNRQYQDLVSPTGKLGQINAEKINIAKINEDYDKLAKEKGWSQVEADYWKGEALKEYNDLSKSPIWDEKTGRLTTYTGPRDIANKVDYSKKMHDYASQAKMSTTEFAQAAQQLAKDEATGQSAVMGHSYSKKWGDNTARVLDAYKTMKMEMSDPTSEVYKSMQYERRDPNSLLSQLGSQSNIYLQTQSSQETGDTINPFGDATAKKSDEMLPEGVFDPDSTQTLENLVKESDYTGIGQVRDTGTLYPEMKKGENAITYLAKKKKEMGVRTYKDVLDPSVHAQFEKAVNILVSKGKLPKGTDPMKITEAQASTISSYMKENSKTFTIGNDIIRPDIAASSDLFMGELVGKDANQRNALMDKDLDSYKRDVINPETNKPFTRDEWKSFRADGGKVVYDGYDSPINFRGYHFGNAIEQEVMAHKVILYDKNNQPLGESAVTRTPQEMKTKEFKSSYNITHSYRNAIKNPGKWMTTVNTKSGGDVRDTKGISVKYNNDGTMSLKKGTSVMENITPQQFAKIMYNEMIGVQK